MIIHTTFSFCRASFRSPPASAYVCLRRLRISTRDFAGHWREEFRWRRQWQGHRGKSHQSEGSRSKYWWLGQWTILSSTVIHLPSSRQLEVQHSRHVTSPAFTHQVASRPKRRPVLSRLISLLSALLDAVRFCTRFIHLALLFGPVIVTFPIWYFANRERFENGNVTLWWVRYLVWAMEESGPTFTKLGQWASSRTDLFPPYVCDLLAKLQSNVRPHSMQQTRRVIEKEYGLTLEEIFEWFEDAPIGVGAIAQVHRARLRKQTIDQLPEEPPSMECAVKVLHPNVVPLVTTDLRIMSSVAHLLSLLPDAEWLSLPDEVRMFGAMMYEQLDLTHEARNLDLFNRNFSDVSDVAFPKAVKGLERKSVLVEEYLWAIPLGKVLDVVDGTGGFEKEVGRIGLDSFLHMLIIDNFVHADLHPGNLFLTFTKPLPDHQSTFSRISDWFKAVFTDSPKPVGPSLSPTTLTDLSNLPPKELQAQLHQLFATNHSPRLIFLDAGLVSVLSSQNLRNFLDLFEAVALFQGRKVARLMMTRSRFPHTVINPEGFEHDMEVFLDEVKQSTLKLGTLSVADILGRVFNMVRKHHIKIEGDFANVGISIALLEGVGRRLDPDTDLLKAALPVLRKAAKMRAKLGGEEDVSFAVYGQGWRYWAGVIYTTARPWLKPILDSLLEMERRAGGFDAWVIYYPDV